MPKEKKQSSSIYIAATLYLTSILIAWIITLLVSVILGGSLYAVFTELTKEFNISISVYTTLDFLAILLSQIIGLIFGIQYGVKYIKKTYVIKDTKKIVKNAMIWFFLFSCLVFIGKLFTDRLSEGIFLELTDLIIKTGLFYFIANKYIDNTD